MSGYSAMLKSGKEIYIPKWPINTSVQNLTHVSNAFGTEAVINIATLNIPAVIVAIMSSTDPRLSTKILMDFVCEARIDSSKILPTNIDSLFGDSLVEVAEIFAHVLHYQYSDFFESGLAKEASPSS